MESKQEEASYKASIFYIAGVQHAQYKEAQATDGLGEGIPLTPVLEPDNQYDNTAVALYWEGYKLGYIPQKGNEQMKKRLHEIAGGLDGVNCFLTEYNPDVKPWQMFKCIIEVPE